MTEACAQELTFPHLTSNNNCNIATSNIPHTHTPPIQKLYFSRSEFWGLSIMNCEFSKYNVSIYTLCKTLVCIFWKCLKSRYLQPTMDIKVNISTVNFRMKERLQVVQSRSNREEYA